MCILLHFCVLPVCTFSVCAVHLLVHVSVLCVIYLYVLKSSTLRRFVCLLPSQLCAYSGTCLIALPAACLHLSRLFARLIKQTARSLASWLIVGFVGKILNYERACAAD